MKKMLFAALPAMLALTGCMSVGFELKTKVPADPGKVVVVVPAAFADRVFPITPLLDAAAYRGAFETKKDAYEQLEAIQMSKATAATIDGIKAAGYQVVKADDALTVSLAHDLTPWAFDPEIEKVDWSRFAALVKDQAAKANAQYVVVEGWRHIVDSVGLLGFTGTFHVLGGVAVFNASGKLVGLGSFHSDAGSGGSGDTNAYNVKLSLGEGAKELLIKALTAAK